MKKLFFLSVLFFGLTNIYGQVNFKLQSDATFKTEDGKNYVVIEREGMSAKDLYNEILVSTTLSFKSGKDVISKVENQVISINGISHDCVHKSIVSFSIQYVINFRFRDGKIRVDSPKLARLFTNNESNISPIDGWLNAQRIFKNNEPNNTEVIAEFENELNGIINAILNEQKENAIW